MTILYGIGNCDTVRKARKWLADNSVDYRFHDFRKDGLDATLVRNWIADLGWQSLLNRSGRTWRSLPDEARNTVDEKSAVQLMLQYPSVIKRPVLQFGNRHYVGYKENEYRNIFG